MSPVESSVRNQGSWLRRLTEPSAEVIDRSERRMARLLSTILLLLVPLATLSAVLQLAANGGFEGLQIALAGAVGAIGIAYVLSRTRHYRIAGAVTTMVPTAAGIAVLALDPADPGWFAFMALNPALGGLLLPIAWSVALAATNLVAVVVATAVVSGLEHDLAIVAIMFNAIVSVVLLTAAVFRNQLESDRRADLVARQELQDSILEGTFSGVAIVRDGLISEANHAFAQLVQVDPDQLSGTRPRTLFGVASDERVAELETPAGRTIEMSISRPDGSSFDAEVVARNTPDGTAKVVAVRDITERKRNDRALVRAQRMESVGRVAAGLAHDTNNELFVIAAHAEGVRADLEHAGLSTVGVEQIRDASDRIAILIGRVLQFGRDDESAPEPVDLGVVIEENAPIWRQVLGAEVNLRLDARKPCVALIDRTRVEQLLLNLVLNARDALDGAGEVGIASQLHIVDDSTTAAPAGLAPGRYHLVTVTDNGHGIPPDDLPHVFDPFFTTKDHDHGTGLGLYTSREIARSAGGDLSVVSEGGRTTLAFYVPEHISSDGLS